MANDTRLPIYSSWCGACHQVTPHLHGVCLTCPVPSTTRAA